MTAETKTHIEAALYLIERAKDEFEAAHVFNQPRIDADDLKQDTAIIEAYGYLCYALSALNKRGYR